MVPPEIADLVVELSLPLPLMGFSAGQPVTITAQDGVLIIRAEMAVW